MVTQAHKQYLMCLWWGECRNDIGESQPQTGLTAGPQQFQLSDVALAGCSGVKSMFLLELLQFLVEHAVQPSEVLP